jgi:hypothetical protein
MTLKPVRYAAGGGPNEGGQRVSEPERSQVSRPGHVSVGPNQRAVEAVAAPIAGSSRSTERDLPMA